MSRYFSCSERLICKIANTDFESLSRKSQNRVMCANTILSYWDSFDPVIVEDVVEFLEPIGMTITDKQENKDHNCTYYVIGSNGQVQDTGPTQDEMRAALVQKMGLPDVSALANMPDDAVVTAFNNLCKVRANNDDPYMGYLLVSNTEVNGHSPFACKITNDSLETVLTKFEEYVEYVNNINKTE